MTPGLIALIISTAVWAYLVWFGMLPLLSMPIARIKREFVWVLMSFGTLAILVEWFTKQDMHLVSIISLIAFVVISSVMVYLLKRLDYYVEEVLQELFVLAMSSSAIGILTSFWYWGVEGVIGLGLLRWATAITPVIIFAIAWKIARQKYSLWAAYIYVVLMAIKWITLPYWGIWSVIIIVLYSTLTGYVAEWMISTTYAEKVLAWNISPAKVWSLMVLSAGILVLFF